MANFRRELVSELRMIWDCYFFELSGVKLILRGSMALVMMDKVIQLLALNWRVD